MPLSQPPSSATPVDSTALVALPTWMVTRSLAIQPPPPKPTGAPGAPDHAVSSSHGFGSSTLNSGLAVAPLSSPTRVSAMAPVDAFWGTRTGPAPHRLPYPSACSGVGSAVPPNDT